MNGQPQQRPGFRVQPAQNGYIIHVDYDPLNCPMPDPYLVSNETELLEAIKSLTSGTNAAGFVKRDA